MHDQVGLHHLEPWLASQMQQQQRQPQRLVVWRQICLLSTALPCHRLQGTSKPLQRLPALGQGYLGSLQHPPVHLLEVQLPIIIAAVVVTVITTVVFIAKNTCYFTLLHSQCCVKCVRAQL